MLDAHRSNVRAEQEMSCSAVSQDVSQTMLDAHRTDANNDAHLTFSLSQPPSSSSSATTTPKKVTADSAIAAPATPETPETTKKAPPPSLIKQAGLGVKQAVGELAEIFVRATRRTGAEAVETEPSFALVAAAAGPASIREEIDGIPEEGPATMTAFGEEIDGIPEEEEEDNIREEIDGIPEEEEEEIHPPVRRSTRKNKRTRETESSSDRAPKRVRTSK